MSERVGFISTRFEGLDGVSLESAKWAEVLWGHGHVSYWYGGRLDRDPGVSFCVPEVFFGHEENMWINRRIIGKIFRSPVVTSRIMEIAGYLKKTLYEFVRRFDLTFLIIENALSIPMHVPLGIAITEFLGETRFPAVAHHNDFYWERDRFAVNAVADLLEMAFPPRDPNLQHVVINQAAQEELSWRKGISSTLIPNVLDFENNPPSIDEYSSDVRESIGLDPDDIVILQPTRVVPRKGIEHSIKLVEMLGDPRYKLVVSHDAGDEGYDYLYMLQEVAHESNVDMRFISTRVGDRRGFDRKGEKVYRLWDLYPHAGLVTYPSLYEGFGNAFLESIYFRIPVLINRYNIFTRDIEPKGFNLPVMNGYVSKKVVDNVRLLLEDEEYKNRIMDYNYEKASRFFSYSVLRRSLKTLITNVTGVSGRR
jgi:glycosyltransferase involved in cell wall biosynthesis